MLADRPLAARLRQLTPAEAKKAETALLRAQTRKARAALAGAPVPTEEAREPQPATMVAPAEELPVNPYAPLEHIASAPLAAPAPEMDAVRAVITLFPPGAKDFVHPDEDRDTRRARRKFNDPTPPTPRLPMAECNQAARRAALGATWTYGPVVTRLVRVEDGDGQRKERTIYGKLSALQGHLPDAVNRQQLEAVGLAPPARSVVRMDLYPKA